MSTKQLSTGILFALLLLLLGGCGAEAEPTPAPESVEEAVMQAVPQLPFVGTSWQVESAGEVEDDLQPMEGTRATVNFGPERYSGSGGCNWFLGVYQVEGEALRFATPAQTRLICETPDGIMEQEATFMSALVNVTEYREEGEKLLAYTVQDQLLLTFVPAEPIPFEETTWLFKFQSIEGDPAPLVPGSEITAAFDGDTVTGSSGCNTYEAGYQLDGDSLTVSEMTVTEVACEDPAGVMAQEDAYLSALQSAASLIQTGAMLEMADADGKLVLLYGAP